VAKGDRRYAPSATARNCTPRVRRGMADDGDQITLTARLHPQDAEAAVLVVEGDAFDQARQDFAIGLATFISAWSILDDHERCGGRGDANLNAACLRPEHAAVYNPSPR
jgi:hypothetical protein